MVGSLLLHSSSASMSSSSSSSSSCRVMSSRARDAITRTQPTAGMTQIVPGAQRTEAVGTRRNHTVVMMATARLPQKSRGNQTVGTRALGSGMAATAGSMAATGSRRVARTTLRGSGAMGGTAVTGTAATTSGTQALATGPSIGGCRCRGPNCVAPPPADA